MIRDQLLLIYLLTAFVVGIACLGVVVILSRRRDDVLARWFLPFYASLSVMVMAAMLDVLVTALRGGVAEQPFVLLYLESFIGRYGVMLTLPLFAHRAFGVRSPGRDWTVVAIVGFAFIAQHVTEFALGGVWDDRGDVFEDVLFAAVAVYALWLGFRRVPSEVPDRSLASRFLLLLVIGLPGIVFDLFLSDDRAWHGYPLGYCILSLVVTVTLWRRMALGNPPASPPGAWGLSTREKDVARLVQRGLSNKGIARELAISPNTVKTHLRSIIEKSGVRSRVHLVSVLAERTRERPTHPNG